MPMSVVATSQSLPHDNAVAASIAPLPRDVRWRADPVTRKPAEEKPERESEPAAPREK
jgi:hypothetical protein